MKEKLQTRNVLSLVILDLIICAVTSFQLSGGIIDRLIMFFSTAFVSFIALVVAMLLGADSEEKMNKEKR